MRSCVAIAVGLLATAPLEAAQVVHLDGWAERAVLVPNPGPGAEYFRLKASARWEGARDVATGGYSVRVTLPGGEVASRSLPPGEGPGARRITILVPATAVRNRRPAEVFVQAIVQDSGGNAVSNTLAARIEDFPTPDVSGVVVDAGPFGWGRPLETQPGRAALLPRPGPDGFRFVQVPATSADEALFVATTEATNEQVATHWRDVAKGSAPPYDPKAGRSDEFLGVVEGPSQPALNLTPQQAIAYLAALGRRDSSGIRYRLPTRDEWLRFARTGRSSAFWWGDQPRYPKGANFLGPEPSLPSDTTAPSLPPARRATFEPNPWGLFHTFGNVAEWAAAEGGTVRLGGHFRTDPEMPLPEDVVSDPKTLGADPFVGVRPVFRLDREQGAGLLGRLLSKTSGLEHVRVSLDPRRLTATLTGQVADTAGRRAADRLFGDVWFLAAVENRITAPTLPPGGLALLGPVSGPSRPINQFGRLLEEQKLRVRWASELPVEGSEWFVNLYPATGEPTSHSLIGRRPDGSGRVIVLIDRTRVPRGQPTSVALSVGAPAPRPDDPRVVSNVYALPR